MAVGIGLEAVSFRYPDGQPALHEVSLEIPAGGAVGILGSNGAGKSTLMLHLNGLLRGSGTVRIGDLLITERTLAAVRSRVGLVFQNPDDQLFMPTVADDVAFGPRHQGCKPGLVEERVRQALRAVGADALMARPPHHLSLGQKKRVALATVLAMDCEVLVLDEPTSGLDPRGRRELTRLLASLPQTRVISTHDLEFTLELCEQVVVLHEGRVVAQGPTRAVLADGDLMERTGLEIPHSLRHSHEE